VHRNKAGSAARRFEKSRENAMKSRNLEGRRVGWTTLAVLLSVSAVATIDLATAAAQTVKRGGTLVIAKPEDTLSFNPYTQGDNGSIYVIEQVCDSLVEADATGRGLRPGLAESWEVSADGMTYTFKLRDAKFSDGSPVTAEDVVFSWGRLNDPSAAYQFLLKPVKSIEKVDDTHVRMTMKEPYSPFLSVASIFASAIVKKAVF
jgi:peptide/nickel transport system substrate-binding protein